MFRRSLRSRRIRHGWQRILLRGIDDLVRAEPEQRIVLSVAAGRGDVAAGRLGDLHKEGPDAASAVDERAFARRERLSAARPAIAMNGALRETIDLQG
jgi:hypothetical protein